MISQMDGDHTTQVKLTSHPCASARADARVFPCCGMISCQTTLESTTKSPGGGLILKPKKRGILRTTTANSAANTTEDAKLLKAEIVALGEVELNNVASLMAPL